MIRFIDKTFAVLFLIAGMTLLTLTGAGVDNMDMDMFGRLAGISVSFLGAGGACAWVANK